MGPQCSCIVLTPRTHEVARCPPALPTTKSKRWFVHSSPAPNLRGYVWVGAMNGAKIATFDDVSRRGPPTERTLLRDASDRCAYLAAGLSRAGLLRLRPLHRAFVDPARQNTQSCQLLQGGLFGCLLQSVMASWIADRSEASLCVSSNPSSHGTCCFATVVTLWPEAGLAGLRVIVAVRLFEQICFCHIATRDLVLRLGVDLDCGGPDRLAKMTGLPKRAGRLPGPRVHLPGADRRRVIA